MIQRPTQASIFNLVRRGLSLNQGKLARAQEQVATGKRILRPSDDAVGTSVAMAVRRQRGGVEAYRSAINTSRPILATASSQLQQASGMLSEARALILQGMNGTISPADREMLASQLELLGQSLLEVANSRSGERYLYSGTQTNTPPFAVLSDGRVEYQGNSSEQSVLIGRGVKLEVNVPGDEIFGRFEYSGVRFSGLSGIKTGTSANSGVGYSELNIRHNATTGVPGAGIALANGGADDTIVGAHTVTIDAVANTAQLGTGPATPIPTPLPTSMTLTDADGSVVVLDMSAWTGASSTFELTGSASISLNGGAYQALTLTETDLELVDNSRNIVLHLDTTSITRAVSELTTFSGTTNIFDTIQGAADDLRNGAHLSVEDALKRTKQRLGEFDRNHNNLLISMGKLGARTQRLDTTENRLGDLSVHLQSLISSVEDADLTEVILDMSRAEQTLQIAQGTGARLIDQTLLNFLR